MSYYQGLYWRELTQLKEQSLYLYEYVGNDSKYDFWLSVVLALTSSGSIAAWAIWQKYTMLWAIIVAVGHVVNAVSHLLPFKKRVKALSKLSSEIDSLYLQMESNWFDVSEGKLSEEEIHKKLMHFKSMRQAACDKILNDMYVPKKLVMQNTAIKNSQIYFANQYPPEET